MSDGAVIAQDGSLPLAPTERLGHILAGLFSLIVLVTIAVATLDEATARFGAVSAAVLIIALTRPATRTKLFAGKPYLGNALDGVLFAGFVFAGCWFYLIKAQLWTGFFVATPLSVGAGLAGLIVLLVLTVRAWGWSLTLLALAFSAFAFAGPYLPSGLTHFGVTLADYVQITWYSFDGVFGRITGLVTDNLLIFLIFGAVLQQTGAGESLIRLSTAMLGRVRGGAAHAAIAASAVFGMMNGSVAANVAGTGVFTIPMIKRQGFSGRFAGAVETAASSGGQLTPPIMAATVFVMADLVGLPLLLVIAAAALPALFKYIGLFAQVYVEAIREDIKPLSEADIPVLSTRDWINSALVGAPILALMGAFLAGQSPAFAGLVGVGVAVVAGWFLSPDFRQNPRRLWLALCEGGINSARIVLSVAVIGIVLAVVNETGVAIRFGIAMSAVGETYLIVALIIAMVGAFVLGMGLPTLPAYLIVSIMIVPTMIDAGVLPLAAHMFVLYFAVFSSIMPPIAYGCFVAAPIAGANPLRMSFTALRISVVGLVVPFVFVYSPSLLLVAGAFSWAELMTTMARLLVSIWMLATALGGADPWLGRLSAFNRALRGSIACAILVPLTFVWGPAVLGACLVGLVQPWLKLQPLKPRPQRRKII